MFATMYLSLINLTLLAQAETPAPEAAPSGRGGNPLTSMLPMFVIIIAIFYFFVFRDQRKKAGNRKEILASLHKGDKILTIGGMIGTIVNIKDDELTVKVDESTNTKITFLRSAVDRVLSSRENAKQEAA